MFNITYDRSKIRFINEILKSNYTGEATIRIFNITGDLLYGSEVDMVNGNSMKKINTENLPQGIYIIEVQTSSNVFTNKLIVE